MINEWLTHLTTRCDQPYRRMGYLRELIAIERRHRRCREAWRPHLKACRDLIETIARQCPKTRMAAVLGSGHLLDIPLLTLAEIFDEVILVDICHLHPTRRLGKTVQNLRFVEADISGVVGPLSKWMPGSLLPVPVIDPKICAGADYVVSANLLAQLPLLPLDAIPGEDEQARNIFARSIIDHHLSYLQSLDCPVTLISETLRLVSNGEKVLGKIDPLFGAPLNVEGEEWWWEMAPRPEISTDFDVRLRVRGVANLNDAAYARFCRNTTLATP